MRGGGDFCECVSSFLEGRSSFDFYSFFGGELHTLMCFPWRSAFFKLKSDNIICLCIVLEL